MDNFVVDVDMGVDIDSFNETVAKEVKGVECWYCQRSNIPLFLDEDGDPMCEDCFDNVNYSYFDVEEETN